MFDLNFGLKLYDFCNKQGFNFDYCLINVDVYFSDILSQDLQASVEQLQDGLSQEVEELPTAVDDNFMLSNDAGRSNQSKWIHMSLYNFIQIPVSKHGWLLKRNSFFMERPA